MKKIILIIIAVFTLVNANSQTEKGKMILGGLFSISGYSNSSYETTTLSSTYKYFNFQVSPNFGYFIKDNLAIGTNLNFQITNTYYDYPNMILGNNYQSRINSMNYGIGVFARYYKKITGSFSFFINGELNYSYQIQKIEYITGPGKETDLSNLSFSLSPGVVYFISPKFGMQATFGNLTFDNSINLNTSTFTFGLNYYF